MIRGVRGNADTSHARGGKTRSSFIVKDVKSFANLLSNTPSGKKNDTALQICYLQIEFWRCSCWEAAFAFLCCKKTWSDWTIVFLKLHIALIFSTCRPAGWNNIWFCEWESTDLTELQIILVSFCNEKNFAGWNKPRKHKRPQTSLIANGFLSQTAATASHASAHDKPFTGQADRASPLGRDYNAEVLRVRYGKPENFSRSE